MRKRCLCGAVDCQKHQRKAWTRQNAAKKAVYIDPLYRRNRKVVLARDPWCRLRLPGCTVRTTTVDHVISVAQGGSNELENLIGACSSCNERKGSSLGGQVTKAKRHLQTGG